MDIKSDISKSVSVFLEKKFNLQTNEIEIQNTKKDFQGDLTIVLFPFCLLYTSPSPRDRTRSRMPSSA